MKVSKEQRHFVFTRAHQAQGEAQRVKLAKILAKPDPKMKAASKYLDMIVKREKKLYDRIAANGERAKIELAGILGLTAEESKQMKDYYGREVGLKRYIEVYRERIEREAWEHIDRKGMAQAMENFELKIVLSDAAGLQQALEEFLKGIKA